MNKPALAFALLVSLSAAVAPAQAQFLNPPLSTVRLPSEEIGETAVELLLERMEGRDLAKKITLASRPIWRASTRQPA